MDRPTLQQLHYVVAVAEHGHFGRAAEACHVSQPGLSAQVKELERRLGVELFERTSRGVLVTDVGRVVIERARAVLRGVDELMEMAGSEHDELIGRLRLGVIPTLSPYLLPRTVATIIERHPRVALQLFELQTAELETRLVEGSLDLALLATPVELADLASADLGVDPFLVAVPAGHPLADGRGDVDLAQLADDRMLLLTDGHCLRDQVDGVRAAASMGLADVQATSLPTLVQMVAAGQGVTLLPASAVPIEARPGNGVVARPLHAPVPHRTVRLAWRARSPRAPHYAALAQRLVLPCP